MQIKPAISLIAISIGAVFHASVYPLQVVAFSLDTQRMRKLKSKRTLSSPIYLDFIGIAGPDGHAFILPSALPMSRLGLAADNEEEGRNNDISISAKTKKKKIKNKKQSGGGVPNRGYVTTISKTEMTDLINRLGLKKVEKDMTNNRTKKKEKKSGGTEALVGDQNGEKNNNNKMERRPGSGTEALAGVEGDEPSNRNKRDERKNGSSESINGAKVNDDTTASSQVRIDDNSSNAVNCIELGSQYEDKAWETIVSALTTKKLVQIAFNQATPEDADELPTNIFPKGAASEDRIELHMNSVPNRNASDGQNEQPTTSSFDILEQTTDISIQTQLDYARNGHAAIRSILSTDIIQQLRQGLISYSESRTLNAYRQKVEVASGSADLASKCSNIQECIDALHNLDVSADSLPFLQHFNVWRSVGTARQVAKSALLSHAAAKLLDVTSVKLYQDSIFHKRPGDGNTPWHSDARMAPFDTSKMITFWIPLQPVPSAEDGGTGLIFADGSHSDFALPYWNGVDGNEYNRLEERYSKLSHHMPLGVGDCTVHAGWTLHCADDTVDERYAYAVSYVDAKAEIREDAAAGGGKGDDEDKWSYKDWVKAVPARRIFQHSSVPIVWPKLLVPKDLANDKGSLEALKQLRQGKDVQKSLDALELAGKVDAATLTLRGMKGEEKKRARQVNQDRAVIISPYVIENVSPDSPFYGKTRLLAVFDGHNVFGEVVAQFACDELPNILADRLSGVQRSSSELSEMQIVEAAQVSVYDAFVAVNSLGQSELDNPPSGGCTATAVVQLGKYVLVANCGDSVSFIATYSESTGDTAIIYVTRKDKPDFEDERQRIEEAGGSVLMPEDPAVDVPRVVGVNEETGELYGGIATSRTIGDYELSGLGITAEPNAVDGVDLNDIIGFGDLQAFAVCLSDGITDTMRLEDIAAKVAAGLFDKNGPHLFISLEDIVEESKKGWSSATQNTYRDDITIAASVLSL